MSKSSAQKAASPVLAREYAKHGYDLYLAVRNTDELKEFANDFEKKRSGIIVWISFVAGDRERTGGDEK